MTKATKIKPEAELKTFKGEYLRAEKSIEISHLFLEIANRHVEMKPLLNEFVAELKNVTGCNAVGIRILDKQGNIPYQAYKGFSCEFYESENPLSINSDQCMCTNVIKGSIDPRLPYCTEGGSFYMNGTTRFLATVSEKEKGQTRNVCNAHGYESVALAPIRLGNRLLGLIHVADHQKDMVPIKKVEVLEAIAKQLGIAFERIELEEALRKSKAELERRFAEAKNANVKFKNEIFKREKTEKKLVENQKKLRALTSKLILTEESEKQKLAMILHDSIGQDLSYCKLTIGSLKSGILPNHLSEILDSIEALIDRSINQIRTIQFEISPIVLHVLELGDALTHLAEEMEKKFGLMIDFVDDNQPKPLHSDAKIFLYRAVRELLINIAKHARTKKGWVSLRRDADQVHILVADKGIGFDSNKFSPTAEDLKEFGLFNIRQLLKNIGGSFEIISNPDKGTTATLIAPLNQD